MVDHIAAVWCVAGLYRVSTLGVYASGTIRRRWVVPHFLLLLASLILY
jgi:hypothetical protein